MIYLELANAKADLWRIVEDGKRLPFQYPRKVAEEVKKQMENK